MQLVKIDKKTLKVVEDEEYDDIGLEDLVEGMLHAICMRNFSQTAWLNISAKPKELPENSPRFVILSYEVWDSIIRACAETQINHSALQSLA